jgi:hypothetical protein
VITPAGMKRGKDGVREALTQLLADLPDAALSVMRRIFEDDLLFSVQITPGDRTGRRPAPGIRQ